MKRRDVLGGAVALVGLASLRARAQARKQPIVGVLLQGSEQVILYALRKALRERGYVDGQNVRLDIRSADGDPHRLPGLAAELVSHKVDLIVATLAGPAMAAKEATDKIPIVMVDVCDAMEMGIVASLAHPGGNITGLSALAQDAIAKQLELLKEAVPSATRFAALCDRGTYGAVFSRPLVVAGDARGVAIELFGAADVAEIEGVFSAIAKRRIDGLVIQGALSSPCVAWLALRRGLPAVSQNPVFARQGGLISYFSDPAEDARRAAVFIDKIFHGAKPADLPVEQLTRFRLVVNLKIAKALRLTIPHSLIARADEVIA